ncbi:hypothetical protein MYX04_14490, partial [Nitrospiraceae bacterium AH_259_D15_M11_P09]|nr:hypothetical protein [Nitrospiraceae bacterium AH_259_D15_M11_P09]
METHAIGEMSVQLGHISPSRTARRAPFGIPRSRPKNKNKNLTFLAGLLFLSVSLFAFVAPLEAGTGEAVYGEGSVTTPRYTPW